jgi:lysophospholipase L1-like esterase
MRLLAPGLRAFLVLGLAASAALGCSDSEPDSPLNPTAGVAGSASSAAGTTSGGSPTATAGSSGTATATAGATATGGNADGGSDAQAGSPPMAGTATAGGSGGNSSAGSGAGGVSPGGAGNSSVPLDPALRQKCTGTNPILCHLDAADGNWDVTVDLGSDTAAGNSRVAAETRHYFGDARATAGGAHELLSFTANVRMEKHDGGQSAPSNILDLVIDGSAPQLRGIGLRAAPQSITIFVAGDSTLCDWVGTNTSAVNDDETGWAQALAQYFAQGVAIANYADSGETAGGFYSKFFAPAKAALKAGDYVFVQFGHNDQKDSAAVASYKTNLMKYVQDARDKQATPVLFTPVSRSSGSDANPGFAGLDDQVRELAAAEKVAIIDLTVLSRNYYKTVPSKAALFADSGTHLSSLGANGVAGLVATAIKGGDLPLKSFVVVK